MSTDGKALGELLKDARLAAALTQEALAERAGVSTRSVQAIERGENRPLKHTILQLVAALQLDETARSRMLAAATATPRNHTSTGADAPAARISPMRDHVSLPIPPTPLLGREAEVAAILALLQQDEVRLLTLTGPGGVGKTRLLIEIAAQYHDRHAGSGAFISLAALRDPDLVPATIARALEIPERGDQPVRASLISYLREKHMLLLLDNLEQVVAAAPEIAALLAACAGLRVICTSRAPLRLRGELLFPLQPLALPTTTQESIDALSRVAAVRLLVERVRAVRPGFSLTPENASAVAAICVRLDGLPLAIELAAARLAVFSPHAVLARLDHTLALLTGGPRDLPERQQTLRNTITWSYNLCTPAQQALCRRLSIFVHGCTLEAAMAVCAQADAPDDPLAGADILEDLSALVLLNLVRLEDVSASTAANQAPRFRMLATIEEYGREQLDETGETAALRRRHAAYFLQLAAEACSHLAREEQLVWLDRLDADIDNLRAALVWALEQGQCGDQAAAAHGLSVATQFGSYWYLRGRFQEGHAWLSRFLTTSAVGLRSLERARALPGAGLFAFTAGDGEAGRALCEESVAICRELDARLELAVALGFLGLIRLIAPGAATLAAGWRPCIEEAFALFQDLDVDEGISFTRRLFGFGALFAGDLPTAEAHFTQCLAYAQARGDRWEIAEVLDGLAQLARARGDAAEARRILKRKQALHTALRDPYETGVTAVLLGELAQGNGESVEAHIYYVQALMSLRGTGAIWGIRAISGIAELVIETGKYALALRLAAAATALSAAASLASSTSTGPTPFATAPARAEQVRRAAQPHLTVEQQDAAWDAGQAMTLEQAIALALEAGGPAATCEAHVGAVQ